MSSQTVSYPCLKSIVPSLPFFLRARLHQKCSHVQAISRSIDFTAKHVKFVQPHVYDTSFRYERSYSATLTVENVTWNFRFDDVTQKVHVTCSLYPGREVVSERKELARETLSKFLKLRVEHLELESVVAPLLRPKKPKCRRLTWRLNEVYDLTTMGLYRGMKCHRFDMVEIVDAGRVLGVLADPICIMARHLIVRDDQIANFDRPINSPFNSHIKNKIVQVTMRPLFADMFVEFCTYFIRNNWHNGSFVDFSYPKSRLLPVFVWESLSTTFPNAVNGMVDQKQVLILDGTDEYVMYVEHIENEERQSFKVTKEARQQFEDL